MSFKNLLFWVRFDFKCNFQQKRHVKNCKKTWLENVMKFHTWLLRKLTWLFSWWTSGSFKILLFSLTFSISFPLTCICAYHICTSKVCFSFIILSRIWNTIYFLHIRLCLMYLWYLRKSWHLSYECAWFQQVSGQWVFLMNFIAGVKIAILMAYFIYDDW